MEKRRDGRVGEGGDERSEGLEGGHPDPSTLVAQQVDEQRAELCLSDGGRADAGDGHEDVCASLPHPPHPVLAQVEKFRQLMEKIALEVMVTKILQQHSQFGSSNV